MKQLILAILLLSITPTLAHASAMSPERSRCYGKESDAKIYRAWKSDFQKFISMYEDLEQSDRFTVSRGALRKIIQMTTDFSAESGVKAPEALISDAKRLLRDLDNGDMTPATATRIMKSGLIKFEDAMDDMIYRAQVQHPTCEIMPSSSSSPSLQREIGVQ